MGPGPSLGLSWLKSGRPEKGLVSGEGCQVLLVDMEIVHKRTSCGCFRTGLRGA